MEYGFLSLVPPLVAIILAIWTRQVYVSLLVGVFMGWFVLSDYHIIDSFMNTVQAFVDVFGSAGNTRTIIFSALIGALIYLMQKSGGVQGFIISVDKALEKSQDMSINLKRRKVKIWAMLTGAFVFVESNISVLTVGTLYRPVFDRLQISRENLAYIADSTSAPVSILIPFNAWGAFIMGLLIAQGYDNPFGMLMRSIPFNIYPILALVMVILVILFRFNIGPMKEAEERVEKGQLLKEGAVPMMSSELTDSEPKKGVTPNSLNMIIPILVMIIMMPVMLGYTGWETALADRPDAGFFGTFFYAVGQGSGSTSVLTAVIVSLLVAIGMYAIQRIFTGEEIVDSTLKGISGMMPLALLMVFAFAINTVCSELGTGLYVADVAKSWLSPALVPMIVFIISSFIAFSTGTSWGTFAIMIAIAMPMAENMEVNLVLTLGAALGGGVFGDHCSPISDTTIISSMASATDHIDHVRTQIPYALTVGLVSALIYLGLGFIM